MVIQAAIFTWICAHTFARQDRPWLARGLTYAAVGAVLSWSFTTIAVAAKNVMASVSDYLVIETAYTVVQWMLVGPLTALAFGPSERWQDSTRRAVAARLTTSVASCQFRSRDELQHLAPERITRTRVASG
jgi:hypothetical protein